NSNWEEKVSAIGGQLRKELAPCRDFSYVADVRVLGAIGVVELNDAVDSARLMPFFIEQGVWVRPFGKIVYLMPPYIITPAELTCLTTAVVKAVATLK